MRAHEHVDEAAEPGGPGWASEFVPDAPEPGVESALLQLNNAWAGLCDSLREELFAALDRLRYLGPLRRAPERVHFDEAGTNLPDDVGPTGEFLAQVLAEREVCDEVNQLLEQCGVKYRIYVREMEERPDGTAAEVEASRLGRAYRVFLTRGRLPLGLGDVGMGIVQLLPVLVQVVLARRRSLTTFIEQPEVHVHPRLAVEIAQSLVDTVAAIGPVSSQVVFESHSPEIALRVAGCVQRRELSHERAMVIFVRQDDPERGAESQAIEYREDGALNCEAWPDPDGFFPERETELLRLDPEPTEDET